jgi:transcriptional regulator with XRE-family HTH domain
MVLLRRVIGDALRARRQGQHRTLREVSTAANVSLGYLSEIERGQKEASSELLASICDALGARLSEVLRDVSDTVALAEQVEGVLNVPETPVAPAPRPDEQPVWTNEGQVSVSVRRDTPLRTTLRARNVRPGTTAGPNRDRDLAGV